MNFKIDHFSPVPLHFQVEQLLRELIEKPEYKNGEFLPGEQELSNRLGVSRNTIRQATNKLEYEGLIVRKKGYGTKVAGKSLITALDNWHSFTQEMNEKGISFRNFIITTEKEGCSEKLSKFFHIAPHKQVLKLVRLRGDEDGPFVYFESFFHPRIGISQDDDFEKPLYDLLQKKYKTQVSVSRENIKAGLASGFIAKILQIKKGDPVLIRERFVSDPGNRPVEYNLGYYIAEKFTYSIEIRR